jgi:hypothetical protein
MKSASSRSEAIVTFVGFIIIYWFLLGYFNPSLLLSRTTTTGGDTASHIYVPYYLKNSLIPRLDILGWTPDWYMGLPLLQFYFPLPYLLMAGLDFILPQEIAFKLVSVLGVFSLPLAAYLCMRLIGFKWPTPVLSAILTLPFLFIENYSTWGGNIKSTMAGQFSSGISLSLGLLFIGLMHPCMRRKRHIMLASFILGLVTICHIYTLFLIIATSSFFLITSDRKELARNLKTMAMVFSIGFALASFWFIPMVDKLAYTSPIGWVPRETLSILLYSTDGKLMSLAPFYVLSIIGLCYGLFKKEQGIQYLSFSIIVSIALFLFMPPGALNLVRFLVPVFLLLMMAAGYGAYVALKWVKPTAVVPLILLFVTIPFINQPISDLPSILDSGRWVGFGSQSQVASWIRWNYEGYENKNSWKTYSGIVDLLKASPPGRVFDEYSLDNNVFGSDRVFEAVPYFSAQPELKGMMIDSAISTYFVFYAWSEISTEPVCPIMEAGCSRFDIQRGTKHLQMFNLRYLIAASANLTRTLKGDDRYALLKEFHDKQINHDWAVFELQGPHNYVTLPLYEPVAIRTDAWRKVSMDWFRTDELLDVPLVFLDASERNEDGRLALYASENLEYVPKVPVDQNCTISETVLDDEVLIDTTCIGRPLIVKISYFPNWLVDGADRIYLVSPSFMLIYPNQRHVRLHYGQTPSNLLGWSLTLIGLAVVSSPILRKLAKMADWPKMAGKRPIWAYLAKRMASIRGIIRKKQTGAKTQLRAAGRKGALPSLGVAALVLVAVALMLPYQVTDKMEKMAYQHALGVAQIDAVDVGKIASEEQHGYSAYGGVGYISLTSLYSNERNVTDDGIYLTGWEKFTVKSKPGKPLLIVKRVDYSIPNQIVDVYANGRYVGTLTTPDAEINHKWGNFDFFIPSRFINGTTTDLQVKFVYGRPVVTSFYYWVYAGK